MALLWVEGFENFGVTIGGAPAPTGVVGRKYSVGSETTMDVEDGRLSGRCLELVLTGCYFQPAALTTNATMVVGVAVKFAQLFDNREFLTFYDGITKGMNLQIMTDGEVQVFRGTTYLGTTSGLNLLVGIWYYIEFKVLTNNTTGTYELRVDGVNECSGTGADTQPGTNAYHTTFRCTAVGGTGFETSFDDLYCLDGSGTLNTDFLGDKKVVTIRPNAAGDSTQFTPLAGDNYAAVDEITLDDNTTYVEDGTTSEKDLYNYEAVSSAGGISGVMVCTDCCETDANPFTLITVCKSGSTESDDAGQAVGSINYLTKKRIVETNPNSSAAWTAAALNVAQFGVKVG